MPYLLFPPSISDFTAIACN
jgi:hypothetical protein